MTPPDGRTHINVGLAQFKPTKAAVEANLARIRAVVEDQAGAVDIMVFPEAALSGYFLEGGVAEAARSASEVAAGLGEGSAAAPDVVVGFYERHKRKLFNSVGYFAPGEAGYEPLHIHRKMFIPTYGVFDEGRFVEAGRDLRTFQTRYGRVGMLVCEEMWHSLSTSVLALGGAELIIAVSASPARDFTPSSEGRPHNLRRWDALAPAAALEHGVFVVVSQLVGSEGGKVFPGGSMAVGPDGDVLARGPLLEEGVTVAALESAAIDRARVTSPLLADLEQALPHLQKALIHSQEADPTPDVTADDRSAGATLDLQDNTRHPPVSPDDVSVLDIDVQLVERVLIEFIREEVVRHRGFERVVIGLSGGVDSAVSLSLAVRALGAENVTGFRLPYATSSQESLDHADLMLEASGAEGRTIEITGTYKTSK